MKKKYKTAQKSERNVWSAFISFRIYYIQNIQNKLNMQYMHAFLLKFDKIQKSH